MSFKYYNTWWIQSKKKLEELTEKDKDFLANYPKCNNRSIANKLVGGLYTEYALLVQQLDACLDQLCQPQKTITVRKLVEVAVSRLRELYNELRWINFSEYHVVDDTLVEMKLIPHDIEIIHPLLSYPRPYKIQQMINKIKRGEKIFDPQEVPAAPSEPQIVQSAKSVERTVESQELTDEKKSKKKARSKLNTAFILEKTDQLTPEQQVQKEHDEFLEKMIKLIQRHERARQFRLYHFEMKSKYDSALLSTTKEDSEVDVAKNHEVMTKAAITLQKYWRGRYARKFIKYQENRKKQLIGMIESSNQSKKEIEAVEELIEKRREKREIRIKEYLEAHVNEKERVLRVIGPGLMEDIGDEIRDWLHEWYDEARIFDKYPTEDQGGTILVVRGDTMTPQEWIDEVERQRRKKVVSGGDKDRKREERERKKAQKAAEKAEKKKKAAALKKAMKEKKARRENMGGYIMEFDKPAADELYEKAQQEHKELWDVRDEFLNPDEVHYMDLITDEKCYQLQLEIRAKVDELMRIEHMLLNEAWMKDKLKKPKKPKKKKGKKAKKGKKQPKDITAHRTTEDLFQELYDLDIIRPYPKVKLDEFVGDFSYNTVELKSNFMDPPEVLGNIRQAVVLNAILPMGQESTNKIKSMIICGSPQSGKTLLANAIFTSTRCVLFDLSPENLADKYPGKDGLLMLVHLVNKMSRILQPSILYIKGCEKTFYKKVPPAERYMDPKRLGKVLQKKILKLIKPEDRIMLLGTSSQPWAAQTKMKKCYEKSILIPRSDYGSVYTFWKKLLMPYHGVDKNIDLSCLSKVTVKYPFGVIKEAVEQVMVPRRIIQFPFRPLTQQELYEPLVSMEPVNDKIWKKYQKWYNKTPIGKLATKLSKVNKEKREQLLKNPIK